MNSKFAKKCKKAKVILRNKLRKGLRALSDFAFADEEIVEDDISEDECSESFDDCQKGYTKVTLDAEDIKKCIIAGCIAGLSYYIGFRMGIRSFVNMLAKASLNKEVTI